MTWGEHAKRRLFTENLLQDSAALFPQWLLRNITNIVEMKLEFLEKDEPNLIMAEQELRQAVMVDDEEV